MNDAEFQKLYDRTPSAPQNAGAAIDYTKVRAAAREVLAENMDAIEKSLVALAEHGEQQ